MPSTSLKKVEKYWGFLNPTMMAMSVIERLEDAMSSFAFFDSLSGFDTY